ncbi:hypothetical protein A9Q90_09425 [Gammaproteobacteria bacterium 54_18_T64]|mgnify:CR=1 FL=1|nr:hypothetical protein A9Q90_09425 [Gammaproteobacteria bacterium 54_18_T64]
MSRAKIQLRILMPAIVLLMASAFLLFSARHDYRVAEQRLENSATERVQQLLSFLQQEIEYRTSAAERVSNALRLLQSANIDASIEALALISTSGQVLADRFANSQQARQTALPDFTTGPQVLFGANGSSINLAADGQSLQAYITLATGTPSAEPIAAQPALLFGSIDLSASKAALWQQVRNDYQATWIITSLLVLGLALVLERLITRPLVKLLEFSQQLAQDYSGLQNPELYLGEIAALNQALNTMSNKVAHTVRDLNTQQENLEVTLQSIGDAVVTTDASGLVTRMNPVAEQLTGWYAYEARGLPLAEIFPIIDATSRAPIANPIDRVLNTGQTVFLSHHTTLVARDGKEHQIADSAAPIRDSNDDIIGMILVFNDVTQEYQLRQAARNIQRQIEGLFNDMQAMAVIMAPDGNIIFINNTPLKMSGISFADVADNKLWECPWFSHSAELQKTIAADCKHAAAGEQVSRDILVGTRAGQFSWVQFSVHPVFDENGQVMQLLAEGHDISERKKAEEELNASLQQVQLYREQTPLATIEWSTDLKILGWNDAATRLFGYSAEEAIGCDASIIVPSALAAEVDSVRGNLLQHRGGKINTNQNITKDGRSILCEWHNSAIVDPTGKVVGVTSQVLDVSAEHEAKQALIAKEQEQREILNTLVEGIITIDEKGFILSINPAAEKIFGYTSEDLNQKDLCTIMPHFDIDRADQYLKHLVRDGEADVFDGLREITGQRKDRSTFPLQVTAAELPPAADGSRRFIGSCNDLTQTRQQQEHLQRTQKMDALGQIVGGLAHDYNNTLGVILGYADLIAIKYKDIVGLDKYIEQISLAGERGRDLTQRMLAFSKHRSSAPEAIALHSVLNTQSALLGKSITAVIKLEYQLCESPWLVWLNPNELEEILLNLAINARHAMPNGGVLSVATDKRSFSFAEARALGLADGDYMELSIEDNGCGIEEALHSQIFDPFFTTKGSNGTGLGLSQAYSFMDRCGGTIRVQSTVGQGSKFSLFFPRYEGTLVPQSVENKAKLQVPSNAEKILIVDDEPGLRNLTQEILTIAGYQVWVADNADSALKILAREPVDLMISDIIMPQMNGYDLAKVVKQKYPHIKIQLASGYSGEQTLEEDQELLHNNILRKPFRSTELLNSVASLLEVRAHAR